MHEANAHDAVLAELRSAPGRALSATELAARLGHAGARLEELLGELEDERQIVVLAHASPDVHLDGTDLRTVGLVEGSVDEARRAAEEHWLAFLREWLSSHRCC